MQKVHEVCKEFLRGLTQIDDKISILNWYEKGTQPPITAKDNFPDTVTGTHKYLHKLFLPKPGMASTIYPQVFLGHDVDFQTL